MSWWKYYSELLGRNLSWLRTAVLLALGWFLAGLVLAVVNPSFLDTLVSWLEEFFGEVLGEEGLQSDFETVWDIAQNNIGAAGAVLLGGVVLGILPFVSVATNFFILGFLLGSAVGLSGGGGLMIFIITVVPHGILEIPALLLASAFGFKFGMFWRRPQEGKNRWGSFRESLKENLLLLPLLAVLLIAAAVVEVFATGALSGWFLES